MNHRPSTPWLRLAAAARRAPAAAEAPADASAPAGFSTRVVARAGLRPAGPVGLFGAGFNRLAARALGLACACAVAVAVWGSLPTTAEARTGEVPAATDAYLDPVGDYLAAVQAS
jgi:hypothetical protein